MEALRALGVNLAFWTVVENPANNVKEDIAGQNS